MVGQYNIERGYWVIGPIGLIRPMFFEPKGGQKAIILQVLGY